MLGDRKSDSVVVVGLGRFGSGVALSLSKLGHDVLALDTSADVVQAQTGRLAHVIQADATDIETLKQLGAGDFRHAVIGIGQNLEASVLTILNMSQLGIKDIWAKANNQQHGRIAERVGAHHVVYPEYEQHAETAELAAHRLTLADHGAELVYTYDTQGERTGITALLADLGRAGIRFRDLHTDQSSLEDIFVDLVGRLRYTEASLYTQRDTPMFTCVKAPIDAILGQVANMD